MTVSLGSSLASEGICLFVDLTPPKKKKKRKRKKKQKQKQKQQQCIHYVDDIQVIHTNLSTAASGIHLRIKRTIGGWGGGGSLHLHLAPK